jgi:hypothetical protein
MAIFKLFSILTLGFDVIMAYSSGPNGINLRKLK